jgi:hypothetical protein
VPPTVALTSPATGSTFTAPATIALAATATDSNGTITKVQFFQGATILGEDAAAPYTWSWTNVPAGTYVLTAKAFDNAGASAVSGGISVTVAAAANVAPTVALTSPITGSKFTAPATIALGATASDSDGTIARVEFFQGATKIGEHTAPPFTFSWTNVAAGTYVLTAKAFDNGGASTISAAATVTVAPPTTPTNVPPTVALTSPATGSKFTTPATIALDATAADSDGTIAKVEFFQGASKLGEDTAAPFSWSWTNVPAGSYTLFAKAFDNAGAVAVSSGVGVSVASPTTTNVPPTALLTSPLAGSSFIAPATIALAANAIDFDGTVAKVEFFQGATKLGEDVAAPFGLSWPNVAAGTYILTARSTDNGGATTVSNAVTITVAPTTPPPPSGTNAPPVVTITSPISPSTVNAPGNVTIFASASDADGSIARVEFYQGTVLFATSVTAPYSAAVRNLAPGSYSYTARAYDNGGAMTVSQTVYVTVRYPPSVSLTSPSTGAVFRAPATISLAASATSVEAAVVRVEFYSGAVRIGLDLTAPHEMVWTGVPAGSYTLTAKAYDIYGGTAVSTPVTVTVQ